VLAVALPGHAAGPALGDVISDATLPDAVERAMDAAGFETAHTVGNSLGGFVALQLAARGRAMSVVALAPAGGWARGDESYKDVLRMQHSLHHQAQAYAPHADAIAATPEGRRRMTELTTVNYEHIPPALLAHQLRSLAASEGAPALIAYALTRNGPWAPSASPARFGLSGARPTRSSRGRQRPRVTRTSGCPTPTGSSLTAWGTALS
jgi:pimeloyl-ACP methyl ester carboxylesterase